MKILLIALGCLMSLQSTVNAGIKCPDIKLIKSKINTFAGAKPDETKTGEITLESQTWNFESTLTTSEIRSIKSLNIEISDIDEDTCNYLIYPKDSNMEDASLLLHQRS